MRAWYKFEIKKTGLPSDKKDFTDNEYSNIDTYVTENLKGRFVYYDRFLRDVLKKGEQIFSVGSGKCINELLLVKDGYSIRCSDLDMPLAKKTKEFLRELEYSIYDITTRPLGSKYDTIISLSVFFSFEGNVLHTVFKNVHDSLKLGGRLIIDVGGAENNLITKCIDRLCVIEKIIFFVFLKLLRRVPCTLVRRQNGYRSTNKEIIESAQGAGFSFVSLSTFDESNEIESRSLFLKWLSRSSLFKRYFRKAGRKVPYIRFFVFKRGV